MQVCLGNANKIVFIYKVTDNIFLYIQNYKQHAMMDV